MVNVKELVSYVEKNIQNFHKRRLESLLELKLQKVLKRKNPYLFKAKNINNASHLVIILLDAHLSSQEETIFGDFLEKLAVFICGRTYDGKKSAAEGIDLEFERENTIYLVSVKSGPNWGNSRQTKKMIDDFKRAKKVLRTNSPSLNIVAVNGCCYGKDKKPDKGEYFKFCGQRFWSFVSGNENLYTEIIQPLGHKAKRKNDKFLKEYSKVINKFTLEFIKSFCNKEGEILWEKVVKLNSGNDQNL